MTQYFNYYEARNRLYNQQPLIFTEQLSLTHDEDRYGRGESLTAITPMDYYFFPIRVRTIQQLDGLIDMTRRVGNIYNLTSTRIPGLRYHDRAFQ